MTAAVVPANGPVGATRENTSSLSCGVTARLSFGLFLSIVGVAFVAALALLHLNPKGLVGNTYAMYFHILEGPVPFVILGAISVALAFRVFQFLYRLCCGAASGAVMVRRTKQAVASTLAPSRALWRPSSFPFGCTRRPLETSRTLASLESTSELLGRSGDEGAQRAEKRMEVEDEQNGAKASARLGRCVFVKKATALISSPPTSCPRASYTPANLNSSPARSPRLCSSSTTLSATFKRESLAALSSSTPWSTPSASAPCLGCYSMRMSGSIAMRR